MATTNPITGDSIQTKPSAKYADNYDAIFRKDLNNYLLHDPIDGFNQNSNGLETATLASENNLEGSQNGSTITQDTSR